MPCRVGITTNPNTRKRYWESQVHGLTEWRILGTYNNQADAQAHETRYANRYGCHAHAGGQSASRKWYVYRFSYTRVKNR